MLVRIDVDAEKLAQIVASHGMSMRELSSEIGASHSYMTQIIRGVRNPSPKFAKRICERLGIQFDEVFRARIVREEPERVIV